MFQSNDENYDFDQSYNLDVCQYHNDFEDNLDYIDFIEKHRTTNDSDNSDKLPQSSLQQLKITQDLERPKRKTNQIQVRMGDIVKFCDSKQGEKLDTLNLSKNVKTQTSNFLKLLILTKQTTSSQIEAILNYNSRNGSFESYDELFSHSKIKQKCLEFYSSKFFVQNVLSSSKMEFQNKILIIKFLEKIRSNTWKQLKTWKNRKGIERQRAV